MMIRSERPPDRCIDNGTFNTRYGALTFNNGHPTVESAEHLAQMLTFSRAVDIYQHNAEAVAMFRFRQGLANSGIRQTCQVVIWKTLQEGAGESTSGVRERVQVCSFLNLRNGPIVIDVPAGIASVFDDMWQRPVGDVARIGRAVAKGGKYLVLPPGDAECDRPGDAESDWPGYLVLRSPTYGVWMLLQPVDGDPLRAVRRFAGLRIYPLAQQASGVPAVQYLNRSHGPIDTSAPADYRYFEQLGQLVEQEPAGAVTPLERFHLAQIGMRFGHRFAPDDTMKALLAEAALVGDAAARMTRNGCSLAGHRGTWRGMLA
ncbi:MULTISPECIES: DUF1254 domain-containing protein [unclassified Variovorax]|uniref:DUF1254 domain-containing protein n=1 Tax=unclassified Variovorax TaxID=663243 RepID=UPI001BD41377|nr:MULTISPECIES: DUF1254 domain-containing protein [unclassified Variovorax]